MRDFIPDEEVAVELDGAGDALRVRSLTPLRARQPPGTEHRAFLELNARAFCDFSVRSLSDDTLTIVAGGDGLPPQAEVRFGGVTYISLPMHFSYAYLRLASPDEVLGLREGVEVEGTVFCVVTDHGSGDDGARCFVIAREARCCFGHA